MMKHGVLIRSFALILTFALFCSMFLLPTPVHAADEQETYTAHYGITSHWVEKDGLKDQYGELDLYVQMPFLRGIKEPIDVLFIADVSSSMDNPVKGEYPSLGHYNTLAPLSAVKDGMDTCAGFLSDSSTKKDRFGLIAFSSKVERSVDFTNDVASFKWEVLHLSSKDSSSNYCTALTAAKEMLENRADQTRPAYVIFMTDGEPDIQRAQAADALKDLADYADIYAVQFGCTVDMLSAATKTYRVDTPEEMFNAVPFALSDATQCGKWAEVNISLPASGDFVISQASPAEKYGSSVVDSNGIKYTATNVPSGVTYTLHYPLTLADEDTLKTELTVNTGGTFSITASDGQPSPATGFAVQTLSRPRYTVTYDGNGSTSGSVPVDTNRYIPGSMVEYPDLGDLKKEVDGKTYQFQGWRVKKPSSSYDYGSYFSIYGDTVVEATWTTASVAKTSNTRGQMKEPVLMSFYQPENRLEVEEAFHQSEYKEKIVSVTFLDRIDIPENTAAIWDVSEANDGSVQAWVMPGTAANTYDLFIAGKGGVIANPNSAYLFGCTTHMLIPNGTWESPFRKLERINGLENLDTSRVTNMDCMFRHCVSLESLDLSSLDMSSVVSMREMFYNCASLTAIPAMPRNLSALTDVGSMFSHCSGLTSTDLSGLDTSSVTNMNSMFSYCNGLTTVDLSSWNTGSVTNMGAMFYNCDGLTSVDLSGWDAGGITNIGSMFDNCDRLTTVDLSGCNIGSVTNIGSMFSWCRELTDVDLSGCNTSSVASMTYMFYQCTKLTNVNFSGWDTSSLTDMGTMFYNCTRLTNVDFSGWDTSNVTSMGSLFNNCSALTSVDLGGWDTSSVTSMAYMFDGCTNLTDIGTTSLIVAQNCNTTNFQRNSGLPPITITYASAASRAVSTSPAAVMTVSADEEAQGVARVYDIPDVNAWTQASMATTMTTTNVRASGGPRIIDMGEIHTGDEIDYQITVKCEGDSDCYSGDITITDPIPDGLTVKADSISITATRMDPNDESRASYRLKQAPQVNGGVLSLCLTGVSTGSQVVIEYTCTAPATAPSSGYKQFLNTAVMEIDGQTAYTDTIRHWIGPEPSASVLYNVSYEYSGNIPENAPALPQGLQYTIGETVTVAPVPSVPGYIFNGWKREFVDTDPVTSFTMPDTNITLIGTWTKAPENVPATVKVKYEYRGDNIPAGVPVPPAERSYNINKFAVIAAQPASEDYIFDGWHCDDSAKVTEQDLADGRFYVGETDTVLYGSWSPKSYTVSYEYAGTVPTDAPALPAAQSFPWGIEAAVAAVPADTAEYVFSGWNTTAGLNAAPPYTSFPMPKEDVIFRGSWTRRTYSVTYVYTGTVPEGAQAVLPIADAFYPGDSVSVAAAPALAGYTFSGWSVQSGLADGSVAADSFTMPAGNVIFQGSWEKIPTPASDQRPSSSRPARTPAALNTEEHTSYIIGRGHGGVQPLEKITRAETATIFYHLLTDEYRKEVLAESCDYPDVDSAAWYNLPISTLTNAGILSGYPDGTFRPDAPITRAEFAAVAARFDSDEYSGEDLFPDVVGHWASESIYRAAQKGWVTGYPNGTFRPDQYITRAEAITLVNHVLGRDGEASGDPVKDAIEWLDVPAGAWYHDAVREATNSHSYRFVDDGELWLEIEPSKND